MSRKRKKRPKAALQPDPLLLQAVSEFVDPYHDRASISSGRRMIVNPGQILENIELAMERVDNDIDTPVAIEDVLSVEEGWVLANDFRMGPTLAVYVVNIAMRIMSARYPAELVRAPLPPDYDLRKLQPFPISDQVHETAKTIFNRQTASAADLTKRDIVAAMELLDASEQIQVFMTLFLTFGSKVGAIQFHLGS